MSTKHSIAWQADVTLGGIRCRSDLTGVKDCYDCLGLLAWAADAELLIGSWSLYNFSCLKPTFAPSYDEDMALVAVRALRCR